MAMCTGGMNQVRPPLRKTNPVFGVLLVILAVGWLAGCGPDTAPTPPKQALQHAWDAFRLGDYKLALKGFTSVMETPGIDQDLRLQALHGLATTWDLRRPVATQDDELASTLYRQIMDEAPDHDLAAWSSLALARMTHLVPVGEEPDYDKVRAAYQTVIDAYPNRIAGQEALLYQQATLIQTLDPERTHQAIERLQTLVDREPASVFSSAAYDLIAQGYETLNQPDRQLEARIRSLETAEVDPMNPSSSDLSWRYWQIATTAEFLAGRFDIARTYYRKLIEEYPLDYRKFGAKQALIRMDRMERELREQVAR